MIWVVIAMLLFAIPLTCGFIFIAGMAIFMRNQVVDSSNMFNWLRVVAFCAKHPEELLRMRYVLQKYKQDKDGFLATGQVIGDCPWEYIADDEYSDILKVRS